MIVVDDLQDMDRVALVAAWGRAFSTPAPKGISRTFLRRFLAFELQARRFGGLPKSIEIALAREGDAAIRRKSPALKPGDRILREWNGVTHVVDVTDTGFVWNGTRYRSLTAIAREITGAHWSGPRFFGLAGKTGS
jgi:hypothetical protein